MSDEYLQAARQMGSAIAKHRFALAYGAGCTGMMGAVADGALESGGEVIGVIALEKAEASYYTDEHIQAVTTFAGQAAVALENANLFEESARRNLELDQRSHRLALLNRLSTELSGSLDLNTILDITIREFSQAFNCSAVSALLFDAAGQAILQAEAPHVAAELPAPLPDA